MELQFTLEPDGKPLIELPLLLRKAKEFPTMVEARKYVKGMGLFQPGIDHMYVIFPTPPMKRIKPKMMCLK